MSNIEITKALVKAQLEIKQPKKEGKNPMFKSNYVTLDAINDAIRLPLANNGLSLWHSVELVDTKYTLLTVLAHVSGETIQTSLPMFVEKVTSQGFGSALTYSRRYSICSLLSLSSDEDDDGNEATAQQTASRSTTHNKPEVCLSAEQCDEIDMLIEDDMELLNRILTGYKVQKLKDISSQHFASIIHTLRSRKSK